MKRSLISFYNSLYLNTRLFLLLGLIIGLFITAYLLPALLPAAKVGLAVLGVLLLLDLLLLYRQRQGLLGRRSTPERFSNGDPNEVFIYLENRYPFPLRLNIIDEVPQQFQMRKLRFGLAMPQRSQRTIKYQLRPVERGEYHFGALNLYASSPIGLVSRRYTFDQDAMVPTYPSYIQMRKYQLMAISNRLTEMGVKKIRRLGHTTEFEQIKEYVRGDDYRTVNWKATARSGKLMVNQYTDERAQNVYCLVDKSRVMKMPFEGMSLLDYAINASLVLSNIALYKQDKSGLITFAERVHACVPANHKATQMNLIMEVLYNQQTRFLEADYARLYAFVKRKISHRSLLILFTNFESIEALHRQLPYLQKLSRLHLLVVIFFENTELRELIHSRPKTLEDIYIKTIGENFAFEKRQIVKELEQHGIISVLCPPEQLTVSAINKYLELKARGMI
ncbi:MAG: DUF58 domain-containing protein [Bacteroidetes bacterium]|nr:MAG: DUF58 domain-containing protein [Bacteroidota bacterium]